MVTEIKNLLVSYSQTKSSDELFHGITSDCVPFFKAFGEMSSRMVFSVHFWLPEDTLKFQVFNPVVHVVSFCLLILCK
jgi:hypothetical protein